ncbi:MAG: hypothetical protein A2288_02170 [Candidatus Moranbacteria bacterium RIFOXYA12_FULL_44_15]|nr:MAG: hypothetical protein A2288_02170 [Candidatus Moranbacteria bacterium RIFOXYA12_FULL_44_15]OGI34519.1 MAG: hypothetical protein A2259_01240 [Candidatus Moranbacteria bacterium RIFOXYA2_FULL_43_15]
MSGKKTKAPARDATREKKNSTQPTLSENFLSQYDEDSWHSVAGGEKREKKKPKMKVSGKSVFKIKGIIVKK